MEAKMELFSLPFPLYLALALFTFNGVYNLTGWKGVQRWVENTYPHHSRDPETLAYVNRYMMVLSGLCAAVAILMAALPVGSEGLSLPVLVTTLWVGIPSILLSVLFFRIFTLLDRTRPVTPTG